MQAKKNSYYYAQTVEYRKKYGDLLTIEQMAVITGTKRKLIEIVVQKEFVECKQEDRQLKIHVDSIPLLRKILHLHFDLGVGWSSMGLVLDLLQRIDELENRNSVPKE